MKRLENSIDFRPLAKADLPLLKRWLEEPHVRDWWGEPDEELALIRAMVEGEDSTRPYMIQFEGHPIGYAQYWQVGELQTDDWTEDHPWLAVFPADAVGMDICIGDDRFVAKGVGPAVIRAFVRRLQAGGLATIIADPDPENSRAVRAFEKAGFRPVPNLEGMTGYDVLILQFRNQEH